jgi:phosphate transport system protein
MRITFHQQLDTLTTAIAEVCALASRAMQDATQPLPHADAALAERVIAERDEIDVRTVVVTSSKNVADADRMGALALHVAEIVGRCYPAHPIPEGVNGERRPE